MNLLKIMIPENWVEKPPPPISAFSSWTGLASHR